MTRFGFDSIDTLDRGYFPPFGFDSVDILREQGVPQQCRRCAAWLYGADALNAATCWRCSTAPRR